ncbi:MAG: hypothetical protein NVS4B11_10100 [Ktedonobacteraceae bacterium]
MQKIIHSVSIQQWVLFPLRLFLSITFVYAGIQKIMDPQFFQASASGYIGRQIARFALGSPIHVLLVSLAEPHAKFFGILIIFGEIAIGLGTLFGFLFRPAAFFGALLSMLFFLSASWHVYPYFYGADIVFTFAWLTLMLNGPINTGLSSLDEMLSLRLLQAAPIHYQQRLALLLSIILGTVGTRTPVNANGDAKQITQQRLPHKQQSRQSVIARNRETRRTFLWGSLTGGAAALGIFAVSYALNILRGGTNDAVTSGGTSDGGVNATTPATTAPAGTATNTTSGASPIAQVSAIPKNSAMQFTIPSTGDPGVLVHLNNDQFVAYDALCTHAGCQVDYDPSSQLLQCPCHGAAFDPAKGAEVVNPPASVALPAVKIQVDSATGAITLV